MRRSLRRNLALLALGAALLPGCVVALGNDGDEPWNERDGMHLMSWTSHEDTADRLDRIEQRLDQLERQCAECAACAAKSTASATSPAANP